MTSARGLTRTVAAVGLALLVLMLSAAVGSAATKRFTDPNDARGIDIRSVRVSYGAGLHVRARYDGRIRVGQTYALWIDTNRRNPGPEYYFSFIPWSEVGSLQRVSGFRDRTRTLTQCQRLAGGVNEERQVVGWDVAGRCLHNAKRVRIALQFTRSNGTDADWAPGFRQLYPWVRRF